MTSKVKVAAPQRTLKLARASAYDLTHEAFEGAVLYGIRRAFKHSTPTDPEKIAELATEPAWQVFLETFDWPDEPEEKA